MKIVDNYEVFFTSLQPENAPAIPIVVLTFGWKDVSDQKPVWNEKTTSLRLTNQGLVLNLVSPDHTLLFQLGEGYQPDGPLDRMAFLRDVQAHGGLHVCAFDDAGEPLVSLGFIWEQISQVLPE